MPGFLLQSQGHFYLHIHISQVVGYVPRSVKKSIFLDIKKALKSYSTDSKLKSVEMVLEAFDSMDARNIRFN